MATLKAIRKRIVSTKSTMKLTRAMKMIASAKLRRAQTKALESRVYRIETERILRELMSCGGTFSSKLLAPQEDAAKKIDLMIISSDRGMCGTFNETMMQETASFIKDKTGAGFEVNITVFGKKGRDFLKRNSISFNESVTGLQEEQLPDIVEKTSARMQKRFTSGETCEALIAFNSFISLSQSKPVIRRLFPAANTEQNIGYKIEHICEPSRQNVFEYLLAELVRSSFYQAFVESAAGELAARMMAMDKATKNANELITSLTSKYNRARQGAITTELIDIVSGAEALK